MKFPHFVIDKFQNIFTNNSQNINKFSANQTQTVGTEFQ